MFFVGFYGKAEKAKAWSRLCEEVAKRRNSELSTRTYRLDNSSALTIGWISRQGVSIDTLVDESAEGIVVSTLHRFSGDPQNYRNIFSGKANFSPNKTLVYVDRSGRNIQIAPCLTSPERIFYQLSSDGLYFSDDLRVLLCNSSIDISPAAIFSILQFGAPPAPLSISRSIARAKPGHLLDIVDNTVRSERFLPFRSAEETPTDEDSIRTYLRKTFPSPDADTVVLFSGGIDSSVIAVELDAAGNRNVTLANFIFDENDPEGSVARRIASHTRFPFQQICYAATDTISVMERLGSEYSCPFSDPGTLPTNVLLRAVSEFCSPGTTVIEGAAADVIFGYASVFQIWGRLDKVPKSAARLAARLYRFLNLWRYDNNVRKVLWVLRTLSQMPLLDAILSQNCFDGIAFHIPKETRAEIRHALWAHLEAPFEEHDFKARIRLADLLLGSCDIFSSKTFDPLRNCGANPVYPYLNSNIVEMIWSLPDAQKFQNGVDKFVLKKILSRTIPNDLIYRPKSGLAPPLSDYLSKPDAETYTRDMILQNENPVLDYVDKPVTERMFLEAFSGTVRNKEVHNYLWAVIFLSCWIEQIKNFRLGVRANL